MKKIIAIILLLIIMVGMTACVKTTTTPTEPTTIIMPTPENYSPAPTPPENTSNINILPDQPTTVIIIEDMTVPEGLIEDIFILVNQARMDAHIEPLMYNSEIQYVADLRAKEISEKFSHQRPDGTECFTAFPDDYNVAGENLIMADHEISSAEILMDTWMNSEGHRENILAQRFTSIAIGIYQTETLTYVTQIFVG